MLYVLTNILTTFDQYFDIYMKALIYLHEIKRIKLRDREHNNWDDNYLMIYIIEPVIDSELIKVYDMIGSTTIRINPVRYM
jgi:hypothetical protein